MTTALIINIVLGAVVLTAVVGMLAWSITTQNIDAATRSVRRRRRMPAHARRVARADTIGNRA